MKDSRNIKKVWNLKGMRDIETRKGRRCPACNGTRISPETNLKCRICNGKGMI
ncbi:MAG: hypothetical protein WC974_07425 [Thermoplasmata archaeon]